MGHRRPARIALFFRKSGGSGQHVSLILYREGRETTNPARGGRGCAGEDGIHGKRQHWEGPCGTSATCSTTAPPSDSATASSWPVTPTPATRRPSRPWWPATARWSWPPAAPSCKHEHDVEDAFQATFLVLARKARSVRAGDALGGWLHRVAYRAAVQASAESRRRRRREAEATAMATLNATHTEPDPDIASIVHEEIDRLPDRQRLPVVLCDLEGLTYEQAAGRLRWTEPTLRHRLVKARQRLRDRLTRRGITAGAVGVVTGRAGGRGEGGGPRGPGSRRRLRRRRAERARRRPPPWRPPSSGACS